MDDRSPVAGRTGGVRPLVALTAVAVVALAACTSAGSSPSPDASRSPVPAAPLEGTPWRLTEYMGPDGGTAPVPEGVAATALFERGTVSGNSGCNSYTGSYVVDGDALTVSGLATTMMACEPVPTAVEQAFTAALANVTTYSISGDVLELKTTGGKVGLRFTVAETPSLTGTRWVATGINNGKGGVASVVAGTTVTALFGDDGTMTGSSGCNAYSGSYTIDGSNLAFSAFTSTRKACVDEAVTTQETQYLAALGKVRTFGFAGDRLQLRDESGALQVQYEATLPQ